MGFPNNARAPDESGAVWMGAVSKQAQACLGELPNLLERAFQGGGAVDKGCVKHRDRHVPLVK